MPQVWGVKHGGSAFAVQVRAVEARTILPTGERHKIKQCMGNRPNAPFDYINTYFGKSALVELPLYLF
jgi:hypothetical protein